MISLTELPPIEDALEAACYRAILKLVVPELRIAFKDFKFNWPMETRRGGCDWTTCLITHTSSKCKHNIAVLFGSNQLLILATNIGHIEMPIADPEVHTKIIKYVTRLLERVIDGTSNIR